MNVFSKTIFLFRHSHDFFKETFVSNLKRRWRYHARTMHDTIQHISGPSLGGDILHGADGIAAFLYGNAKHRRKVYNLVETNRLPHFRLGAAICARKSVLLSWITAQEKRAGTGSPTE